MKRIVIVLASVMAVLCCASLSWGASATLSWDAPTTNADGTPLTDLAGYKVYRGNASRTYGALIDAGNVTTYTLQGLGEGTHYFAITAYDTEGNESEYSNEVSKAIAIPPAGPNLKSTVIIIIAP